MHEARIGSRVFQFFANFDGLQAGVKATPDVQRNIEVRVPLRFGARLHWLPFMGSEPKDGVFDFSHVDRVLKVMDKAGLTVIVGTPTHAIPTWLAREHPDGLAITPRGPGEYGRRQNIDITNPSFRKAASDERHPDIAAMNKEFGLDYWSNKVNAWEDLPSVNGAINASLTSAFVEFQCGLVTEYLAWQASLVRAHARKGQFTTQNFDLDWRGYSYGVQSGLIILRPPKLCM